LFPYTTLFRSPRGLLLQLGTSFTYIRESRLSNCERMLERAGAWFLHSGIQEANGGVARYYRSDLGKNARVSTEITGYAVSTLLYLAERTGNGNCTDAAIRAARFLTDTAWSSTLCTFPFEHSANCEQPKPLAYFFH